MPVRPVVAVRLFRFDRMSQNLSVILLCFFALPLCAQAPVPNTEPTPYQISEPLQQGYLARIGFNDPKQLAEALDRVQVYFEQEQDGAASFSPISIVVHGPEVEVFEQNNYQMFKPIVDKAAQLSALGLLDISVCETRLRYEGIGSDEVYPFVGKVLFGPAEIDRLINEEEYIYF